MKQFFFISLFVFANLTALSPHHIAKYEQHADTWLSEHVVHENGTLRISEHDLELLVELFRISYQRSQVTVDALPIALEALNQVWHGWQNIAQTRRNPSLNTPYTINKKTRERVLEDFWQHVDKHRTVGQAYADFTEEVINGGALESEELLAAIKQLRLDVRSAVLEAMLDIKQQLELLNKLLDGHSTRGVREMVDFVLDKLPGLTYYSFVQTDRMNKKVSTESWQALMLLQEAGNAVWDALESARATFYRVHYEKLLATS